MKKNPFLSFKEHVAKRQIRTEDTTFSFHIYDLGGSLGLEVVEILRNHKPLLGLAASRWVLPKLVRIFVEDVRECEDLGGEMLDESSYFDIRIELEKLYDVELLCKNREDFRVKMLWLFLHELAHLKMSDEEDDLMVANLLKAGVRKLGI